MRTDEEIIKDFLIWMRGGFDFPIESFDDRNNEESIKKIIHEASNVIGVYLAEIEQKCIAKDLENKTNTYSDFTQSVNYQKLKRVGENLMGVGYLIQNIFELKHRRTKENFELRAEIVRLKQKIK